MKHRVSIAAAALACGAALAQAQPGSPAAGPGLGQRANQPVFHSGNWFVVRSVREGGSTVACTGFYRGQRRVQLSQDALILKSPVALQSIGLALDGRELRQPGPPAKAEASMGAVVLSGPEFEALAQGARLTLEVATAQGRNSHTLELNGLAAALENIQRGCPVPQRPLRRPARP